MKFVSIPRVLLFAVALSSAAAQGSGPSVTPGQVDGNGAPTSGAKLCAATVPSACYTMPDLKSDGADYWFGLDPHVKTLVQDAKHPLYLFNAHYTDGNTASLTRYTLLQQEGIDARTHFVSLLPPVDLTNFSDFEVWDDPNTAQYPTVISADFIWDTDSGEQRKDPHHFNISVWRYKASARRYTLALTYKTDSKYAVVPTAVGVVDQERQNILDRLQPKKRAKH